MSWKSVALRLFVGLAFAFWAIQVLAVAVFAVGDRYSGVQAVFYSLFVLIGGFAPVVLLGYLFRDHLLPGRPAAQGEALGGSTTPSRDGSPRMEPDPLPEPLSEREVEVLTLIARGLSNKEIAGELSVTVGTVKTHTNNINRKLGSRTRTQALARAREHGLL
jgi:DNA-binding CsgD family transcriptional regulator